MMTSVKMSVGAVAALVFAGAVVGESRTYEVEVDVTWSTMTHPGAFPGNAHLSHFGGGVHSDAVSFWEVGTPVTAGGKQMAETGVISILSGEVQAAVNAGTAKEVVSETHWFCPAETNSGSCGATTFEIEVDTDYPLVTLASMIGPSPDWFVGVSAEDLRDGAGWAAERVVDIRPYDAGTRSNDNTFNLFGPENNPAEGVSLITNSSPQLIGGDSLGSIVFRLVTPACAADFDVDGVIGAGDLAVLLAAWGQPGVTDIDGDGVTDSGDLAILLAGWGVCE